MGSALGSQDEGDDEPIQGQGFSENQDQDHADKDFVLLGIGTHAGVSHDADGEPCSQGAEAAAEAGSQMGVGGIGSVAGARD